MRRITQLLWTRVLAILRFTVTFLHKAIWFYLFGIRHIVGRCD